ncbi:protein FIP1 isoform X4 [Cucumis melo]|uniref:Protein FIP1 isoform X4 n=1 Tax=Cucumis melo TaxID=3656 RepID=A0ABM3KHT3_CUCME|nr:protein FIP1 isoform X4 [Cucumis melo]
MAAERHASSRATSSEDNAMFLDILHEAPLFGHRKPARTVGSIIYCFVLASYAALAIGAPWIFHPIKHLVEPLLCSCHVVLLMLTVTAYGTAALLLVMVWEPQISALSIPIILRLIMLIEAVCAGSFMIIYISYVQKYNSLNSQPDVLKSLYSPLQQSSSLEDLRYHDVGRLSDQQMALLQYQRENLHFLNEEILRLQECLSKYERSSDGSTPQVDLAHMLAARDQELRTLSAEMNQVTSELRLARSVIAERDTEIQKLLTTNKQYVEENERLRAILGEWSTRAAKLERALEAERMSNIELQKRISTLKKQPHASETSEGQRS